MFTTVWEYEVGPDRRSEFIEVYGATGAWVALFRRAPGYRETVLLQDVARPERFITLDRWVSREAYEEFLESLQSAYQALDRKTAGLTRNEHHLGMLLE